MGFAADDAGERWSTAPAGDVMSRSIEPPDDFDTTAEVDATFRTQRRVALGYFAVFLAVTFAVPALTLALGWWSTGRIFGMSPNFVMAAGGLYVVFFVVALAASSLADAIEARMLGGGDEHLGALPPADLAADGGRRRVPPGEAAAERHAPPGGGATAIRLPAPPGRGTGAH
jgi:uncharacterized membrane protein